METALGLVTAAGLVGLVVGCVLYVRVAHAAKWRWFALGVFSWACAVAAKAALEVPIAAGTDDAPTAHAVVSGFVSALTELGAAALFFLRPRRLGDLLAFGVGIGCFELVFKVLLGIASAQDAAPAAVGAPSPWLGPLALVEHASTIVGHTATRVLIYLAVTHRRAAPALIALATFSVVDGGAMYGGLAGWQWERLEVYVLVVLTLAAVACLEATAARVFWRRLGGVIAEPAA